MPDAREGRPAVSIGLVGELARPVGVVMMHFNMRGFLGNFRGAVDRDAAARLSTRSGKFVGVQLDSRPVGNGRRRPSSIELSVFGEQVMVGALIVATRYIIARRLRYGAPVPLQRTSEYPWPK